MPDRSYASGLSLPLRPGGDGRPARVSGADYVRQSAALAVQARGPNPFLPGVDLDDDVFGTGGGVESRVRDALAPLDRIELARVDRVDVERQGGRMVVDVELRLVETRDGARLRVEVGS